MATTLQAPDQERIVLDGISWQTYSQLLRDFSNRHLRLTYDRGVLEITTLSHEHESTGYFLARLVDVLTEELELPVKGGGSPTIRRKPKKRAWNRIVAGGSKTSR